MSYKTPRTRVRKKDEPPFIVPDYVMRERFYDGVSGLLTADVTSVNTVGTTFKGETQMVDVVTPGFKEIQAKGGIVNNPMSRVTHFSSGTFATWSSTTRANGVIVDRTDASPWNPAHRPQWFRDPQIVEPEGFERGLMNRAYANATGTAVDLLVDFLEREKTVHMLRSDFTKVVRSARKFKSVVFSSKERNRMMDSVKWKISRSRSEVNKAANKKLLQVADTWSGEWLKWRYGYRPLLMSIGNTLDAMGQLHNQRVTGRAKSTWQTFATDVNYVTLTRPVGSETVKATTRLQKSLESRAGVISEVDLIQAHKYGVGIDSLPTDVWELVPYSFVVDWFYDVGSFLRAWTQTAGVKFLTDWVTMHRQDLRTRTFEFDHVINSATIGGVPWVWERNALTAELIDVTDQKTRVPNIGRSFIQPTSLLTELRNIAHAFDGTALLYQQFGKGRKR